MTHPDSGTTTVIDTATNTVIDTDGDARNGITGIAVGGQPMGVAVHLAGTTLYVADLATDTVAVIDTATHSTIDMDTTASNGITGIAVGPKPVGVAVHPAGSRVYVETRTAPSRSLRWRAVLPRSSPRVIDTIPVDDCANTAPIAPWGLAVTPDGTAVYVANAHEGGHPIVDAATLRVIGLIQGADGQPLAGGSQVLSQFIGPPGDATALALGSERALTGGTEESGIGLGQAASETTARDLSGFPVDQAAIRLAGPRQGTSNTVEPPTCGMSTAPSPNPHVFSSQPVGGVPADFQLSEFTGAATFNIPMNVPPGRARMQPALALTYSSGSPNGPVGVGWSIGGVSRITRCAQTFAQDGKAGAIAFDADDRFCLDGARLVAIKGDYGANDTEYRTEQDQNLRIIGGAAGPESRWNSRSSTPTGTARYGAFGNSIAVAYRQTVPDNRAATSRAEEVRWSWALSLVSDRFGNFVQYFYRNAGDEDTLEHLIDRIEYTAWATSDDPSRPARRCVAFQYEQRPDPAIEYVNGLRMQQTRRLRRVSMFAPVSENAGEIVWSYDLQYVRSTGTGRSLLSSVAWCDAHEVCLRPTTVAWTKAGSGFDVHFTGIKDVAIEAHFGRRIYLTDIDADGRADLLYTQRDNSKWLVCLSQGIGYGTPFPAGLPFPSATGPILPVDFNVDGRSDLLIWELGVSGGIHLHEWDTTHHTFSKKLLSVLPTLPIALPSLPTTLVADLDGNGATDLLRAYPGGVRLLGGWFVRLHEFQSDGFRPVMDLMGPGSGQNQPAELIEFDGDPGLEVLTTLGALSDVTHLLNIGPDGRLRASPVDPPHGLHLFGSLTLVFLDLNGDGLTDHCDMRTYADLGFRCRLSTGRGWGRILIRLLGPGTCSPNRHFVVMIVSDHPTGACVLWTTTRMAATICSSTMRIRL